MIINRHNHKNTDIFYNSNFTSGNREDGNNSVEERSHMLNDTTFFRSNWLY